MKSKFSKFMGVVIAVVTVASLFVMAVPVTAAVAPQTWNVYATPSTTGMVLSTTITAGGPIAQASDSSALYAYINNGSDRIIKSIDNGRTWKASGTVGQPTAAVVSIVCSATEPLVVFYATAATLYKSVDGGVNFLPMVGVPATDAITSLDVAKWGGRYIAVVGVNSLLGGATLDAGVYYWDESLPFNNLTPVGTTTFGEFNVLAVAMAPTFAIDRAVVAIGTDTAADTTIVRMDINGGAWGAVVGDATFGTAADATAGDVVFPSDFNALTSPIYFFCVADADAADGGIYRMIGSTPTRVDTGVTTTNLSYQSNGTFTSGTATVLAGTAAGTVKKSTNSGNTFSAVTLRSAYTSATAWVLLDKAYSTSKLAWVLNVGGAQGALNVTTDGSVYNQWSLINDSISGIRDYVVASNGDVYMITTAGTSTSIWRNLVSAGTPWERVYWNTANTADSLKLGADYATAKTVAYWILGSPSAVMVSTNSANSFTAMTTAPGTIVGAANAVYSLYMVSSTLAVVGDATGTITANTSAYWWVEIANKPFGAGYVVTSIVSAGGTNLLAAAYNGTSVLVAKSADNGVTWALLPAVDANTDSELIVAAGGNVYVAPAADYATSGNVFVAASSGIWRYPSTATAAVNGWLLVDGLDTTTAAGLVTAAGGPGSSTEGVGMVYAADGASTGTVYRVRGLETSAEFVDSTVSSAPAASLSRLQAYPSALGNVQLWALGDDKKLYTYNDTLGVQGTGVAVSNVLTVSTSPIIFLSSYASSATVTFNNLANATDYYVYVNPVRQTSFFSAATVGAVVGPVVTGATTSTVAITAMVPGTVYFVSVWADNEEVSSFMFAGASVINTPLAPPAHGMDLTPALGATNVAVQTNFAWSAVAGATSYKLDVTTAADTAFANPVYTNALVPASNNTNVTWNYTGTLAFNTSYIWRVMANGVGSSAYVMGNFTTEKAVVPPVTVTNPPAITLTIPPVPTIVIPANPPAVTITVAAPGPAPVVTVPSYTLVTPTAETPSYIWIIVGVGALLTLAVIILIIRTRRVV